MPSEIIKIHQCISGFTQTEKSLHGVLRLSEELHTLGMNNHVSRVSLRPWNDNWAAAAENMFQLGRLHGAEVIVNIYAYSWGGGWGALQLAQELEKRGVMVLVAVLSDAVYRHPRLLMRWTSLLGRNYPWSPTIKFPANVATVIPFHQSQNRPQGHKITGRNVLKSTKLSLTHQYMDDAPEFLRSSVRAAKILQEAN